MNPHELIRRFEEGIIGKSGATSRETLVGGLCFEP